VLTRTSGRRAEHSLTPPAAVLTQTYRPFRLIPAVVVRLPTWPDAARSWNPRANCTQAYTGPQTPSRW
jgi:hypothetical protein